MGPTDTGAADNYMKDKTLSAGEQMAKIVNGNKTYVITLKSFNTQPLSIDRSKETPEEAAKRRQAEENARITSMGTEETKKTVRTNIYTPEEYTEIKKGLPTLELKELLQIEGKLLKQPKGANGAVWKDPKTGQALVAVRKAIEQRKSNIQNELIKQKKGGTRKRKMRSKKTLRHK